MIGKLKGILSEIEGTIGLIETSGGVFYETFLTNEIVSTHLVGTPIEVFTYLQVRDDALVLFGFSTREEYKLFTLLLSVSGVGPKTAFGIVSVAKMDELLSAITKNDLQYFTKVPGLGKKTAMKIILELSQKLKQDFDMEKMYLSDDDKTVIDALVALGFKTSDARTIFAKIPKDFSVQDKIKEGLRIAGKK